MITRRFLTPPPSVSLPSGYVALDYLPSGYVITDYTVDGSELFLLDYNFVRAKCLVPYSVTNGQNSYYTSFLTDYLSGPYGSSSGYQYTPILLGSSAIEGNFNSMYRFGGLTELYGKLTVGNSGDSLNITGYDRKTASYSAYSLVDGFSTAKAPWRGESYPLVLGSAYFYTSSSGGSVITVDANSMKLLTSEINIYRCQVYSYLELVRDYVPCINPQGAYGVYDTVTKTFSPQVRVNVGMYDADSQQVRFTYPVDRNVYIYTRTSGTSSGYWYYRATCRKGQSVSEVFTSRTGTHLDFSFSTTQIADYGKVSASQVLTTSSMTYVARWYAKAE